MFESDPEFPVFCCHSCLVEILFPKVRLIAVTPTIMDHGVLGGLIRGFDLRKLSRDPKVRIGGAVTAAAAAGWCAFKIYRYVVDQRLKKLRPVDPPVESPTVNESFRAGSKYSNQAELPPYQFRIYTDDGTHKTVLGSGWCYKGYLLTALHVIENRNNLIYEDYRGNLYSDEVKWRRLDTDLVVGDRPYPAFLAAVTSAKIVPVSARAYGSIVGAPLNQNRSHGELDNSPTFGLLTYSGSTRAGFSGSPYQLGDAVAGMHLQGGSVNQGYSASYIAVLLATYGVNKESSDWEHFKNLLGLSPDAELDVFDVPNSRAKRVRFKGKYWHLDEEDLDDFERVVGNRVRQRLTENGSSQGNESRGEAPPLIDTIPQPTSTEQQVPSTVSGPALADTAGPTAPSKRSKLRSHLISPLGTSPAADVTHLVQESLSKFRDDMLQEMQSMLQDLRCPGMETSEGGSTISSSPSICKVPVALESSANIPVLAKPSGSTASNAATQTPSNGSTGGQKPVSKISQKCQTCGKPFNPKKTAKKGSLPFKNCRKCLMGK